MNRRGLLLGILAATTLAAGARITTYTVRLDASSTGAGVAWAELRFAGAEPGGCLIPVGFRDLPGLALEAAPPGTRLEAGPSDGQSLVRLTLPEGIPADATVRFRFDVPEAFVVRKLGPGERQTFPTGNRLFRHAFVNTQPVDIEVYRFEFCLPAGARVQAIREQLPRLTKTEVGPRVALQAIESRKAAVLLCRELHQGDDTSMGIELLPEGRSYGWLAVGLLFSALYLIYFRDLVSPANP
jgi:hypothetical protein